ncbi:MAG: 4Fe-4S dicluster domain-containing protein [Verrucomicrobia bacterium]|jgi:coenzyme F420 hydrogenase subunit beta|nr:4Fe-4S dicluster domain-containing protein [Verrucomicrobiota bacterium]
MSQYGTDMTPSNISDISAARICNTCGACVGVCPADAIKFVETAAGHCMPEVDDGRCNDCGLCSRVCPSLTFGNDLFRRMPKDAFAGVALETCVGRATNEALFSNSSSGGVVSGILAHALQEGRIQGAVTVSMSYGCPPRPVIRIARTEAELLDSQKSKYCPIPLLTFLKQLPQIEGRVGVVALPCHIHGLHNVMDRFPWIREKIGFTIGLICDRILTYAALDYLLASSGLPKGTNATFHYRDKSVSGWPGDVHVLSDGGRSCVMPSWNRTRIKDYFTPARCRICFDKMNVFSDITVGDPHGINGADLVSGESVVVSRTQLGKDIVSAARQQTAIKTRAIKYEEVLQGQGIKYKRAHWRAYMEAWERLGSPLPNYWKKVKPQTPAVPLIGGPKRDLLHSFRLGRCSSREAVFAGVGKALRRRQLERRLRPYLRIPRGVLHKLLLLCSRR